MTSFTDLLQQGAAHAWLFIPTAILLGALHGLEPGHSKTMMAAFIIAVRGTVRQAVLLGLAATLSHTAIVWVIALGGLYLWRGLAPEMIEPYLQVASAVIIIAMGAWMLWRTRREQGFAALHDHDHLHDDHGHDAPTRIDTGHGVLRLEVFEDGVPPRFRIIAERGHIWPAGEVSLETERPDGARQAFGFEQRDGYLESREEIPEPHEFVARLSLAHGGHAHDYDVAFIEHHHGHDHMHEELRGLDLTAGVQDAHELAHANDIRRRFADQSVTTAQIVIFGLTGGLIPCPGAITVLLLCLQLKAFTLGAALVLCFSIGLALTMVASGVIAALSVKHVSRRFSGFGEIVRKAPYVSGTVILLIGLYLGINGWLHLPTA
ncbi:nickel/cobalt efflux transporter [Sphingomonas canadensis]|uniref:Nickel/cobalt efflux system n=1 Tax=Sphingomonas canadensis TaxID=1219257 RepID=A0ABW3HDZ2_9SPHN|nr:nickel/cobalt efflux transporter [Sphingomonas canadensis]MCW3837218.1 nickel/cobalt efflux transporter [Sphingomonas canadensis]